MSAYQTHAKFQTTQWPLVDGARAECPQRRAEAVATLVGRYWPPIYASLRRMGHRPDDAAEITQGYFADVVLGRGLFEQADGKRGRLRTLMITALKRYLTDRHRRAQARGAGRVVTLTGLAREESIVAATPDLAPEEAFERRWALAVLEEAIRRCEAHFRRVDRAGHWSLFEARILHPSINATKEPPLADLAPLHGFHSAPDAASAIQVVKKRLIVLLREVIAETTTDVAEQEEEFNLVWSLGD